MSSTNFIQWNSQGFANKKVEIMDLISKAKPDFLCIQDTILSNRTIFNLKDYNGLFIGYINYRAHGGAAIFIHIIIPYEKLILNTPLQAITARLNIERDVSIVFIYNSRSYDISENLSTLC